MWRQLQRYASKAPCTCGWLETCKGMLEGSSEPVRREVARRPDKCYTAKQTGSRWVSPLQEVDLQHTRLTASLCSLNKEFEFETEQGS